MTYSYWQLKGGTPVPKKTRPEKNKYDIAIIGAGITGVAAAYYLSKFGCPDHIVLDKHFSGYGASGRNAGFLLSGLAEPYSRLVTGMGNDSAREIMTATIENHDLIADSINENKINCGYKRSGSYHLAVTEVERLELIETVDLLVQDGFKARFINTESIEPFKGKDQYYGGFYNPMDGCLDPFAFVQGLGSGLNIIEGAEVQSIEKFGDRLKITTGEFSVEAEMAILATNAYSPMVDGYFKNLIFPVRGQMVAVSAKDRPELGDATYYANFGYDYFRNENSRQFLMGGLRDKFVNEEVGYEDKITPNLQKGLEDYIKSHIGIKQFEATHRWSGVMATTTDGLPLVGALPHNSSVIVAAGMNGHGFGLGMIIARDLARAIIGDPTSDLLKRFSLNRIAR